MIITVDKAIARDPSKRLAAPVSFDLKAGESLAIMGLNASGKTLLTDMLIGKVPLLSGTISYPFSNIRYLAFRDSYGTADASYYYQQRWNIGDQGDLPTVAESLGECPDKVLQEELFDLFQLRPLLNKYTISLSSGELRKFQLARTLFTRPQCLIMDNPYIGLDESTREALTALLARLAGQHGLAIILVLSMLNDVPSFVTHVLPVRDKVCGEKMTVADYWAQRRLDTRHDRLPEALADSMLHLSSADHAAGALSEVIRMDKLRLQYGDRIILKDLDWLVCRGEKWALRGENGSGKSALLSLVCADNPQAYACPVSLFGRKRGTGESIWEIKKHIGYISPEMHRAYLKNYPAIEIVASGLQDSVGLYVRPKPEQFSVCEYWMHIFGIADLKDRPFLELSSGEQRLCLLARAFVKDPELLILDEPLHGLDTYKRQRVKSVVETFCRRPDKTIIMATHYPEELPACIDHTLFLKKN